MSININLHFSAKTKNLNLTTMKTTRISLFVFILIFTVRWTIAQENLATQLLLIHEDNVIVGKASQYAKASTDLVKLLTESNFQDMTYSAFWVEDYTYMYVSPIENMAQLDDIPWAKLSQQVGKDKTEAVFAEFNGTYNTHRDFIAIFHPDLSYKSEQLQEEGYNYREWNYMYYNEIHQDQMMNLAKEWKKLYEDKNVSNGYTIYTNGFGHEGPVLVIHTWATNPVDHAQKNQKRQELLGEEAQKLWERTAALTYRIETKTGWLMSDMSYMPQE